MEFEGVREVILCSYSEVVLKSDPVRRLMTRKLLRNVLEALKSEGIKAKVYHKHTRVMVEEVEDVEEALEVLKRVFGIVRVMPSKRIPLEMLEGYVRRKAGELLGESETFAVRVRRVGEHPFRSIDVARKLGSMVVEVTGKKVDLKAPQRTLHVEIRDGDVYLYTERFEGAGGLPLGVSGRVVALVSGGIDSPVAAWMMMRRGCRIYPLYGELTMTGDRSDLKRYVEVLKVLKKWHYGEPFKPHIYTHMYPLVEVVKKAKRYTCIICRRIMYRVACRLAEEVGAKAIVTGENLAQVASQTLDNLYVIDSASNLPVLRPLIGMDKVEIEELARKIGTYQPSTMRVTSGCTPITGCWARPSNPATKARLEEVERIEREINVEALVEKAVSTIRRIEL